MCWAWRSCAATIRQRRPKFLKKIRGGLTYFHGVADARFVIRKVFRIVDERAKIRGRSARGISAHSDLRSARWLTCASARCERLDISSAFASKIVKALVTKELVALSDDAHDQRVTNVSATPAGIAIAHRDRRRRSRPRRILHARARRANKRTLRYRSLPFTCGSNAES